MKRALICIAAALCAAGLVLRIIGGDTGSAGSVPSADGSASTPVPAVVQAPRPVPETTVTTPPAAAEDIVAVARNAGPFVEAVFTRSWQDTPVERKDRLTTFATDRFIEAIVSDGDTGADQELVQHQVTMTAEADLDTISVEPDPNGSVLLTVELRLLSTGTYETGEETWVNEFKYVTVWRQYDGIWRDDETLTWSGR